MKVIARHERDDRDIELESHDIVELQQEMGISMDSLYESGVTSFQTRDGWYYRILP